MNRFILLLISLALFTNTFSQEKPIAIAIHGGAGTILKENISPEKEQEIKQKLEEALKAGYNVLKEGGSSVNAVSAAIIVMENSPLFNAGKGAVFTNKGKNELDCSIMDGKTLNAGAASGVSIVKNPILLAKEIMLHSPHVMLSGSGADTFAGEQGLEIVSPEYFFTESRYEYLQKVKSQTKIKSNSGLKGTDDWKYGTVGAVALDQDGNLAAGTSTGGMTNKKYGRIGDSPIIGAGTYANNNSCAVSCTGHGEYFIRLGIAKDISALMLYSGYSLETASDIVINQKLEQLGGKGGLISIDKDGNIAMPFNTAGMYRASIDIDGNVEIKIYND
ncbi:MAG: isoaspartyl peptidase/L-asparaginase [Bacteroidota bacterium]